MTKVEQMPYRIAEVAERANVPEGFVRRLVAFGALPAEEAGPGQREVRRARLLHAWAASPPPDPGARAGTDDVTMLEIAELFRGAGADDAATLRLLGVYADSLRRIAKAEAEFYEANIERRLRATGLDERQLIELGTRFGDRVIGLLERPC